MNYKDKQMEKNVSSLPELEAELHNEWRSLDPNTPRKLEDSSLNCLEKILKVNPSIFSRILGGYFCTSQMLSSMFGYYNKFYLK